MWEKSSLQKGQLESLHCLIGVMQVTVRRESQEAVSGFESQCTQNIFPCEISAKIYLYNHLSLEFKAFHKCELYNASFVSCVYATDAPQIKWVF